MRRTPILTLTLLALCGPPALAAQEDASRVQAPARADLPPRVATDIIDFFNDPATLHMTGRTRIPEDRHVQGDVAVLGGPVVIAGRISGRVVVINGDVELHPRARVDGDLTVVGGTITGAGEAIVGGEMREYSERLRYRRSGERIAGLENGPRRRAERDPRAGRASFTIAAAQGYNRVEGASAYLGPLIETAGSNPLRLRAYAVLRSERGPLLEADRWGHMVTAEQFIGGRRELRLGAGLHSVVEPIEEWHVSTAENSLWTFLFHHDLRDHYQRKGWRVFAGVEPRDLPASLEVEYRAEDHRSLAAGDPFALFGGGWRAQPLVGEGDVRLIAARGRIDTRNDRDDPSTGWLFGARIEHALDADLTRPAAALVAPLPGPPVLLPHREYGEYTTGMLDLRRYNRVDASSRLNFRVVAGGSLTGTALPPQRQHALGGEGSLPGYDTFELDCGARGSRVVPGTPDADAPRFVPSYGCDRFALFQAEYRGRLRFGFGDAYEDEESGWSGGLNWVTFLDAGRGWSLAAGRDEPTAVDVGMGVLFDRLGVHLAAPVSRGGGMNLSIRLGSRF